jgi:hypothetical protein
MSGEFAKEVFIVFWRNQMADYETIATSSPGGSRFSKLPYSLIAAGLVGAFAVTVVISNLKKPTEPDTIKELQNEVEQLKVENEKLRKELDSLKARGPVKNSSLGTSRFLFAALQPAPLAAAAPPAFDVRYIIWLVLGVLCVAYLVAWGAIFFSKTAEAVAFASDTVKTLTGFFCGIVMGLLGLK